MIDKDLYIASDEHALYVTSATMTLVWTLTGRPIVRLFLKVEQSTEGGRNIISARAHDVIRLIGWVTRILRLGPGQFFIPAEIGLAHPGQW